MAPGGGKAGASRSQSLGNGEFPGGARPIAAPRRGLASRRCPVRGCWWTVAGGRLLAGGYWRAVIGGRLLVGGCWWAVKDSNLRHPRCKRGALPAELTARTRRTKRRAWCPAARIAARIARHRAARSDPVAARGPIGRRPRRHSLPLDASGRHWTQAAASVRRKRRRPSRGLARTAGRLFECDRKRLQLTASLSALPALNFGCLEAGIWMRSPVRGLRPSEARRWATLKVPKPTRRTSVPRLSAPVMESSIQSTAFALSDFDRPVLSATAATRSFLFTVTP